MDIIISDLSDEVKHYMKKNCKRQAKDNPELKT